MTEHYTEPPRSAAGVLRNFILQYSQGTDIEKQLIFQSRIYLIYIKPDFFLIKNPDFLYMIRTCINIVFSLIKSLICGFKKRSYPDSNNP